MLIEQLRQIRTTDNNCGNLPITEKNHLDNLNLIASLTLSKLTSSNDKLLIFPPLGSTKDTIEDEILFSINDERIHTSNMMGFIGINDTQLSISSRFYSNENDYFLHYMLQKVFSINLLDLKVNTGNERIWDFILIYLFPFYLKNAVNQGLYKEYVGKNHNDANLKGAIDINNHIRENIPFKGKVAYRTREFTFDNNMTQLIRHTQEFINANNFSNILSNDKKTREAVSLINLNTTSYNKLNRSKIIQKNIRSLNHPFYYEYETLRKVCLRILRREGLSYEKQDSNTIYGIVFDGAWLWEEFLNTYLSKKGFTHPTNNNKGNPISLFEKSKFPRYPDFYKEKIVIDAKYKRLDNKIGDDKINRDDIHQIISYMYVLESTKGVFIYPLQNKETININQHLGKLNGYGGDVYFYGIEIPSNCDDFKEFGISLDKNVNKTLETL